MVRSLQAGTNQGRQVSCLLINFKDKIIPVKISDIVLFGIDHKTTQLVTFSNQKYFVNQTLDELEIIGGVVFYRANRQYLINKEAIAEVLQYFARKLVVKLKIEGTEGHMASLFFAWNGTAGRWVSFCVSAETVFCRAAVCSVTFNKQRRITGILLLLAFTQF